jgi:hypothetical protein
MENIKKIYINENGTFHTTHYNGSWNVIKMETTDDLDYSISIYEYLNDRVWDYEEEEGIELEGEDYENFIKDELEYLSDAFDFELVVVTKEEGVKSTITYLVDTMTEVSKIMSYGEDFVPRPMSFNEAVKHFTSPMFVINGERKKDCKYLFENHYNLFEEIYEEKMSEIVGMFVKTERLF